MSSEVSELERKIKSIEKEIQEIREPLYTALTDLRSTIAELENPFNYISKIINTFDLKEKQESKAEGKVIEGAKIGEDKNQDNSEPVIKETPTPLLNDTNTPKMNIDQWYRQFNILVVSNLLLEVFEKDELMRLLAEYVKDGWINRELAKTIEEAVNKLTINKKGSQLDGAMLEEHLLTLYILHKLSNQPNDPVLPLLLVLLNRLRRVTNTVR